MKTILVSMLQEYGHLNPSFKVCRTLKARGYDVRYLGIPDFEEHIRAQGFDFVPFLPELYPKGCTEENDRLSWFDERRAITRRFRLLTERLLDTNGLRSTIERIAPCLMIVDINHTTIAYLAWRLGIPALGINVTLPQTRERGVPPLRTGAGYHPGFTGRIRSEILWRIFLAKRKLLAFAAGLAGMRPPHELALRAARRFGYPRDRLDSQTSYMPRLVGMPELVLCPEAFDFPRPHLADRHFVESVDLDRREPAFPFERLDPSKPLIYIAMGSQRHRPRSARRVLEIALEVLGSKPEWQAVITWGRYMAGIDNRDCPPNVIALKSAPQLALLKRARVMVTHGGLGSIKECVLHGVPMLVFPLALDQHGNAARVEHHGIGLRGNIRNVSPAGLLGMLEALLENPVYRRRTSDMRKQFEVTERGSRGADVAERTLHGRESESTLCRRLEKGQAG